MRSSPLSQSPLVLPQIPGVTSPMLAPVANKATPSGSVCHKHSGQNLHLVDEYIVIECCALHLFIVLPFIAVVPKVQAVVIKR